MRKRMRIAGGILTIIGGIMMVTGGILTTGVPWALMPELAAALAEAPAGVGVGFIALGVVALFGGVYALLRKNLGASTDRGNLCHISYWACGSNSYNIYINH